MSPGDYTNNAQTRHTLASVPGRFFSNRTLGRKKGLVPIAWVIVRIRLLQITQNMGNRTTNVKL